MKHYMQPRGPILRENEMGHPLNSNSSAPRSKQRKHKGSKENAPPNNLNSMSPAVVAKLKSPLPPRPPSSNPLKRKFGMETVTETAVTTSSDSGVKVIVRLRPLKKDEEEGDMIVQKLASDSLSINGHAFTFDSVADMEATQHDIFQLIGAPLVENCLAGFNSSVFAYGQTGSGKTYTMWGPANALLGDNLSSDQQGLTPRVLERLFARINEEQIKHADRQLKYQCRCSFLEIYNEQITDLLDPSQRNVQIREDVKSGVYVENVTEEYICTMKHVTQLLTKGLSNRRTGATSINTDSSRSHCVFTCIVESRCKSMADGISSLKTSRINLVDLAGSERQKLTGAAGERLKEAGNINRSLSQLGNLINILAEVSQTGKARHIPYRDSKLTFLLQESLGGNAKLAMICAISPAQRCKSETFSTLRFAQRAKAIKNKAIVNEVMEDDVNVLREIIRQLKDELNRMKANGKNTADPNGGHSRGFVRRSLNLLKYSLNCPMILPQLDDDGDEEMEIDEEAVEKSCVQVDLRSSRNEGNNGSDRKKIDLVRSDCNKAEHCDDDDVEMEEAISEQVDKHETVAEEPEVKSSSGCSQSNDIHSCNNNGENKEERATYTVQTTTKDSLSQLAEGKTIASRSGIKLLTEESLATTGVNVSLCLLSEPKGLSADTSPKNCLNGSINASEELGSPNAFSVVPRDTPPVLKSPTPSVSPKFENSRKSLRTASMLTASQKDSKDGSKPCANVLHLSLAKNRFSSLSNILGAQMSKNVPPTEHLAASIHRGLEIIDGNHQTKPLRSSLHKNSFKPTEMKAVAPVEKVHVGVQTFPQDAQQSQEDLVVYLCKNCNSRICLEAEDANNISNMPLVPVDDAECAEKSRKQVPKAVERVLAGSFRREMALEEFCAKQASEIIQLNRLVQQYKHERECNAIIAQTREDKIVRLQSLMDGILPTEDFMIEELESLRNEFKLLKEKYDNHPEVLKTKIELQRVQDELEHLRNFFEFGEREVLVEEIHDLRGHLQYYVDSSISDKKKNPPYHLTYLSRPGSAPVSTTILESIEETTGERLEQERNCWSEAESKWISLAEGLRTELEAAKSLAEKQRRELDIEKKCAEEWKEAMQLAMEGHARMLEQYADLEEKHMQLLARHRNIQEGIDDVKKAASRAGVRGTESKFINALAAEISALKVEREKERRYFRDENKGLQAQLRDTVEAVQAAGELLVRLKEAEEAVAASQKRVLEVEQETEKAYKQINTLKKKHEREINRLNQLLVDSQLPKDIGQSNNDKFETVNHDQRWREEFKTSVRSFEDEELSKLGEPSSWFSGYDRCNI